MVALVVALGVSAWSPNAEASHRGHDARGRNAVLRATLGVVHRTDSEVQVKEVVEGYSDADGIFGFTARDDVWVHLLDD
jgi:hypothetical protein